MMRLLALIGGCLIAIAATAQTATQRPIERTLKTALAAERQAEAYCEAVLAKFGQRPAFAYVAGGESLHAAYVEELMLRRGIKVPANRIQQRENETKKAFVERMQVPKTYSQALVRAAQLQKRNGPLYSRLSKAAPKDVQAAFEKLRREALRRHLPAFEKRR